MNIYAYFKINLGANINDKSNIYKITICFHEIFFYKFNFIIFFIKIENYNVDLTI